MENNTARSPVDEASPTFMSGAREMDAPSLLRAAARLVDRALLKLDTQHTPCTGCGRKHHRNIDQAQAYERLSDTPHRLEREADKLENADSDLLPGTTRRRD